ncbi:MAG: DNA-binding response regulator [Saprospirales bacterium]|nr:MAG: DNA-binding response regulator [Saprospirales bacterium]
MSKKSIDIILADEQQLLIDGICNLLASSGNDYQLNVCSTANNGEDLLSAVKERLFDLVIMDIKLPVIDGLDLIYEIKEICPSARLLVLTNYDSNKFVKSAFKNGADGYLLKKSGKDQLFRAIREVLTGVAYMGEGVNISPSKNGVKRANEEEYWIIEDNFLLKNYLTKRELEVLNEIANDKNNKEIARELYISDQTVSVHRKNIMRKLNVATNDGLIKIAAKNGLLNL